MTKTEAYEKKQILNNWHEKRGPMVRLGVVATSDRMFIADTLKLNKEEVARHTGVFVLETACNRIVGAEETDEDIPLLLKTLAEKRAPRSERRESEASGRTRYQE